MINSVVVIIFILIIVYVITKYFFSEHMTIIGRCGLPYRIICRGSADDKIASANVLCTLNTNTKKLINSLLMKYPMDPRSQKLKDEHDDDDYIESFDETYNLGKGKKIPIVIRDPKTGKLYNINTIMFVNIHELAHTITNQIDTGPGRHSDEFYRNFKWLLHEAITIGIYQPVNYSLHPVQYANTLINGY